MVKKYIFVLQNTQFDSFQIVLCSDFFPIYLIRVLLNGFAQPPDVKYYINNKKDDAHKRQQNYKKLNKSIMKISPRRGIANCRVNIAPIFAVCCSICSTCSLDMTEPGGGWKAKRYTILILNNYNFKVKLISNKCS